MFSNGTVFIVLVIPDVKCREAFSVWFKDYPVLAPSAGRSGDRGRMSIAHELGHLVLHAGKSRFEVDDTEADDFAAEFLMPEAMLQEIKTPVTISSLASLNRDCQRLNFRSATPVAKVAVVRKLAVRLYWMLRTQTDYVQLVRMQVARGRSWWISASIFWLSALPPFS